MPAASSDRSSPAQSKCCARTAATCAAPCSIAASTRAPGPSTAASRGRSRHHAPRPRGHPPSALAPAPGLPARPEAGVNAVPGVPEEPQEPHEPQEPEARFEPGTGFEVSAALRPALARAVERAGAGLEALILSGSHATGEAVWTSFEGRAVSLSDVDLYAVMRTEQPARPAPLASVRERREWGLLAPVEVAFVTLAGLAHMPARPGTVELARSGRVVAGEPGVLARLPRWEPAAIDAEERLLLLENRAFELLWALAAWPASASGETLARLRARHAVLKTALELAAARTLAHGELPAGAAARVARARELGGPAGTPSWLAGAWGGLEPLWEEALAWRRGGARLVSDEVQAASWRTVTRAWCVAWWAERRGDATADPWERALGSAARGSLARRLRRSLAPLPGMASAPGAIERLGRAPAGTPANRIHGSAAVLLLAVAHAVTHDPGELRLPAGALRALRVL